MKFHPPILPHVHNAKDRTRTPLRSPLPRLLSAGLVAALTAVTVAVPSYGGLAVSAAESYESVEAADTIESFESVESTAVTTADTSAPPTESDPTDTAAEIPAEDSSPARRSLSRAADNARAVVEEVTGTPSGARAEARAVTYRYPAGAMAVTLYKDGRQILRGEAADIGGTVYVPVQRFADHFGSFKTSYVEATEQVVITGTNLTITVKVGDPYITVNERILYTGKSVLSLAGWIFVPLTAMCTALNAKVVIRSGYYDAFITSGDPTAVAHASEYYDSTDLYWLSRIISAEARGESFEGQIAVGNVVLNRMRSAEFPSTVKEVIFDTKYGTQFSPVANGTVYNTPTASAVRAAKVCLEGYTLSSRILYFFNPAISGTNWIQRNRPYILTIGNHKFYG